jgi:hypothetical protein
MEIGAFQTIMNLVTMLALLSVAVERVTAMTISYVKLDERITDPKYSNATKQMIAAVFGALIYMLNADSHIPFVDQYFTGFTGPTMIGLLVSGGSGFWNSILKLLSATSMKLKAEAEVK